MENKVREDEQFTVSVSKNYYNDLIGRQYKEADEGKLIELGRNELHNLIKIFWAFNEQPLRRDYPLVETYYGPEKFDDFYGPIQ